MYKELRELFQKYADQGQIIESVNFNFYDTIDCGLKLQYIQVDLELRHEGVCDESIDE